MPNKQRKKIYDAYRPNAVSIRVVQNWFKRFQSGNFDDKDELRSVRPVRDKVDEKVKNKLHHCQQVWRHNAGIRVARIGGIATADFSDAASQRGYVFRPLECGQLQIGKRLDTFFKNNTSRSPSAGLNQSPRCAAPAPAVWPSIKQGCIYIIFERAGACSAGTGGSNGAEMTRRDQRGQRPRKGAEATTRNVNNIMNTTVCSRLRPCLQLLMSASPDVPMTSQGVKKESE
ncbi:hypothetical protein EVAR_83301_1 [Eumeta japonica]|uniref:Mos1 transposase HTH domain-containing protein n=1 Tax=Eumeta variegata TaxID=151549 RepID=A0A4C1VXY2_EUMVA|nr:hypothetical protein EVAR_83301_1 [Eumeta japonica]